MAAALDWSNEVEAPGSPRQGLKSYPMTSRCGLRRGSVRKVNDVRICTRDLPMMHTPMTKRRLLQSIGAVAGAAAVYRTMDALGMLGSNVAHASTLDLPPGSGAGKRVVIPA